MPETSEAHALLTGLDLASLLTGCLGRTEAPARLSTEWEPPAVEEIAPFFPRCELRGLVGRGGMGAVYRAWQRDLQRDVAIKLLPAEVSADEAFAERFRREARTLARLQHRHIVTVHDSGTTAAGHVYFVMEFVDGEDLAHALRRGPLPPADTLRILRETCEALEAAHAHGVVHRDIKPSNILLTADRTVKVVDFGLAAPRSAAEAKLTRSGVAIGTFEYSAPEQMLGAAEVDERADLYSLGVTAYELLTGELPRGVFDPPSKKSGLHPVYDDVILRAMASEPARRYATAAAFREALERPARAERRVRRLTRVSIGFGLLGTAAAAASVVAWWQRGELRRSEQTALAAQREAEGLVDFMLTDLRKKLEAVGRLDALDDVVNRADAAFAQVPAWSRGADFEGRRARFWHTAGVVRRVQKQWPAARTAFERSRDLFRELADRAPDDLGARVRAIEAQMALVEFGMTSRDYELALEGSAGVTAQATEAQRQHGSQVELGHLAALGHLGRGRALGYLRRMEESLAALKTGGVLIDALRQQHPDDAALRRSAAWMEAELGSWEEAAGTLEEALAHFRKLKQLNVDAAPDPRMDADVAAACLRLATVLNKLAQPAEALAEADFVRDACRRMAELRPGNREAAQMYDWNLDVTATALRALGRDAEAAEAADRRRALNASVGNGPVAPVTEPFPAERLAVEAAFEAAQATGAGEREHALWRDASEKYGQLLGEASRRADAVRHFDVWIARLREKVATSATGSEWHVDLAHSLNRLGELREAAGEWELALAAYREALSLREGVLAAAPPERALARRYQVVSAHAHVDDVLAHTGDAAARAANVRRMLSVGAAFLPNDRYGDHWLEQFARMTVETCRALASGGAGDAAADLCGDAVSAVPHWSEEQRRRVAEWAGGAQR